MEKQALLNSTNTTQMIDHLPLEQPKLFEKPQDQKTIAEKLLEDSPAIGNQTKKSLSPVKVISRFDKKSARKKGRQGKGQIYVVS